MRFIVNFLSFCIFVTHAYAEENLFNSLASSYLNNPQLNSQREKTKAIDVAKMQEAILLK